jgi:predicted O-methyltransferase YrrM
MLREMPKGGVCAEVGVAEGDFSREIIDLLQPAKLYLIDLWSAGSERYSDSLQKVERELAEPLASGLAEIRRGYSWDELAKLQDESLDWVYIDAAHDYASVKKDLAAARPKIKPGGWICGHDYTRWSSAGIHRWGVVEAVNEFCLEHRWEFRYLTHESHRHISYALTAMS